MGCPAWLSTHQRQTPVCPCLSISPSVRSLIHSYGLTNFSLIFPPKLFMPPTAPSPGCLPLAVPPRPPRIDPLILPSLALHAGRSVTRADCVSGRGPTSQPCSAWASRHLSDHSCPSACASSSGIQVWPLPYSAAVRCPHPRVPSPRCAAAGLQGWLYRALAAHGAEVCWQ